MACNAEGVRPSVDVMACTSASSFAAARFRLSAIIMAALPLQRAAYGLGLLDGKAPAPRVAE